MIYSQWPTWYSRDLVFDDIFVQGHFHAAELLLMDEDECVANTPEA